MKSKNELRNTIVGMCLACLGLLWLATAAVAEDPKPADAAAIKKLITDLELKAYEATSKNPAAMRDVLAEDFLEISMEGVQRTRKEVLADLPDEPSKYDFKEVHVRLLGSEGALLTYQCTMKPDNEKEVAVTFFVTSVWHLRDGKWQNVLYQQSEVPKK